MATPDLTVKRESTDAIRVHVKMEELVLMVAVRTLVIASLAMKEPIVKQVTCNRYKKFLKV